jgi:hypothetical protein
MAVKIKQVQHRAEVNAKKQAQGQNKSRVSEQNASYIDRVLYLQRTVGNREVTRMLRSGDLQPKYESKKPNYILVPLTGGGVLQSQEGGQPVRSGTECTPAPGIPNTDCSAYLRNVLWLPLAYVNNATCACRETPNEPTANCVRKFLQDRLAATPFLVKSLAAVRKSQEFTDPTGYQAFVQTVLTPLIYRDHVDAYRSCCCPSGPADYLDWMGVTFFPLPCPAVGYFIRKRGSCHGTPGTW